jgi:hypothetical protein
MILLRALARAHDATNGGLAEEATNGQRRARFIDATQSVQGAISTIRTMRHDAGQPLSIIVVGVLKHLKPP